MFNLITVLAAFASTASAADLAVCTSGCAFDSIQDAIDYAASGDTLFIHDGTWQESLTVDVSVTLWGFDGDATVQSDGAQPALTVMPGVSVEVYDLRFTDGGGYAGVVNYGSLELYGVTVQLSDAQFGGVLNAGSLAILDHSVVMGNTGEYAGGGVSNYGALVMDNATVLGNQGYLGGGLHNSDGTAVITASSFSGNDAESLGGCWSNHNLGGTVDFDASASCSSNTASSCATSYDVNGSPTCQ